MSHNRLFAIQVATVLITTNVFASGMATYDVVAFGQRVEAALTRAQQIQQQAEQIRNQVQYARYMYQQFERLNPKQYKELKNIEGGILDKTGFLLDTTEGLWYGSKMQVNRAKSTYRDGEQLIEKFTGGKQVPQTEIDNYNQANDQWQAEHERSVESVIDWSEKNQTLAYQYRARIEELQRQADVSSSQSEKLEVMERTLTAIIESLENLRQVQETHLQLIAQIQLDQNRDRQDQKIKEERAERDIKELFRTN